MDMFINENDLVNNPTTRLPVCLCLDTSASMKGQPLKELEKGIEYFFEAIKNDEVAKYSVELAVVTFGNEVKVELDFKNIFQHNLQKFQAKGGTFLGGGVEKALEILEQRKKEYSNKGIDYYQPWLVLMTDGKSGDNTQNALKKVKNLANNKKLTLFPLGMGDKADIKMLKQFSTLNNNIVLKVKSPTYFKEFFEWLSQSVAVASQSVPGDKPKLPPLPKLIEIEL